MRIAAEVKDFDPASVVPVKEARRLDRYVLLGLAAAREAVADASLDRSYDPMRVGILFGSAIGGIIGIMEQGDVLRDARRRPGVADISAHLLPDSASGLVAISLGAEGRTWPCPGVRDWLARGGGSAQDDPAR